MGFIMAAKHPVRMRLDLQSKARLEKLCEERGMTQTALMSRVMKWFLAQHDTVQAPVLGLLSEEVMGSLAPKLLQQLTDKASRK